MIWVQYIFEGFTIAILIYSVISLLLYISIGLISMVDTRQYFLKNSFTDYRTLASSSQFPSVSILAPAYNEQATIVENVKSLLSLYYTNLEVVIINDGSTDETLQQIIAAYDLEKVDFYVKNKLATKKVRGVYKSKNPIYKSLLVVDKENGGKADALNVGINTSSHDYIVSIDVDCVLEQDAILKMMKPFLEETGRKTIASGGVVRIANSCIIEDGRLIQVNLPRNFLARMQTLEYIRAFLLGRMAWARVNGLLIISGAFGAFDKAIAVKAGGYNVLTVGEDMELVVRMRRMMEEEKIPYRITYIPDPLCWTEAPTTAKVLGKQRNRWTRGTIETLKIHKKLFLNHKYGILGLVSYPYWFFFEMLAPLVEILGVILFIMLIVIGLVDWQMFFALLALIVSFGFMYSIFAIMVESATYNQYKKFEETGKLIKSALLEPFFYHPLIVISAMHGYIDLIRKKNSWGDMSRQGFTTKKNKS